MRLQQWKANGWLQTHQTTSSQIDGLLAIVERDLEDSMRDLSPDWQFGIAYNAALKLCTILLYASGFRPEKNLAHYRTPCRSSLETSARMMPTTLIPAAPSATPLNMTPQAPSANPKPTNAGISPANSAPMSSHGSKKIIPD